MRTALLIFLLFSFVTGIAQTRTINSSGNWNNTANWDGGSVGGAVDSDDDVTMDDNTSITILAAESYILNSFDPAKDGTLTINSGGSLTINSSTTFSKSTSIIVTGDLIINGDFTVNKTLNLTVTGNFHITGNLSMAKDAVMNVDGVIDLEGNASFNKDSQLNGSGPLYIGGTCTTSGTPNICADDQINPSPLPVEMLDFEVSLHNDGVEISWTTIEEINNDYFLLERSQDGQSWENVVEVEGAGTSNVLNKYLYVDAEPFASINYYRIVQFDFDQTTDTSIIKSIDLNSDSELLVKVYPNPVSQNDPIHLSFSGLYEGHVLHVSVIDMNGKEVLVDVVEYEEHHGIHLVHDLHHDLAPGTYIVKAINGTRVSNHKLIVE